MNNYIKIILMVGALTISSQSHAKAYSYANKKVKNLICRENALCSFNIVNLNLPKASCNTGTLFFDSSTKAGTAMLSMLTTSRVTNTPVGIWVHDNRCVGQGRKVHAISL